MANLGMTFDPTEVEPDTGRSDPIPEGRYVLQVTDSDVVENAKQTGTVLKLTMEVFDGPLKGRKLFETLNIQHEKVQVQEIGQKQLSALAAAAGISTVITDSQDLHYQPFEADVVIEAGGANPKGGNYPDKNRIRKYHFGDEAAPPATKAAPAARPAAAAPAASGGTKPWQRKVA